MAAIPSPTEIAGLLAEWTDWLAARTDSLLSLEGRVRSAGDATDEADVAAAFVARKAVADRLELVANTAKRDRAAAAALASQPLHDDLGGPVGNNLTDAAELLDAVLGRVEQRITQRERQQVAEVSAAQGAATDLAVAERLAAELGMQVNHVASLRDRLTRRDDIAGVAADMATVRASLEAGARERTALLQRWQAVAERLAALTLTEARVRELAARCRQKVLQAPPLAVPSVATFDADLGDLSMLPWVAARSRITPALAKIDRIGAALAEAERRFQQPLNRREELRGLLQSFADKASASGVMEAADLDELYQQAKATLWAAPCDIVSGGALVDRYISAVNAKVKEVTR